MKRIISALALVFLLAVTSQASTWSIDVAHSKVGFNVKHLVISKTYGQFKEFTGKVTFDGTNWDQAKAEITAQAASIDTDNEKRDEHLRSEDFFDAKNFPTLSFVSKKVVKGEGNAFKLVGDLTIRGVTKEVTFDCEMIGMVAAFGTERAGFSASTKINRQDFKVHFNKVLETGGLVVGDEVTIFIELELVKDKA